ncbi:hypothetical protein EJ03DRAFT_343643 [Teratosphaeria nubilosa]|uniref:Uncharacterized protein n=1 Tax=Teratosphaeria nubilosa TaxID=161662 RepID=A0A6G1L8X2_9PEZI|nr:hypothetical protein EJ03DRAFT_343643 [Teratosphaeria nubilosa]
MGTSRQEKLVILATRPNIAACVQTLEHRCHLPPPAIFHELPRAFFSSQTLSTDPRTIRLVQLAVRQMTRVSTLRIVFGHPGLVDALVRCFFDVGREKVSPIRRLWLENCRISAACDLSIEQHPYRLPLLLDFDGLERLRVRRLPLRPKSDLPSHHWVHSRGGPFWDMQDGSGGQYAATVNGDFEPHAEETIVATDNLRDSEKQALYAGHVADYRTRSMMAYRGGLLDPSPDELADDTQGALWARERRSSTDVALGLFASVSRTLTSLTLDWILSMPCVLESAHNYQAQRSWVAFFLGIFELRFPHLRAFQLRNAVSLETRIPTGLFLLDHATIQTRNERSDNLRFMEAHQNLQCLAWPMDHFFSERPLRTDIAQRVAAVIESLGRTLVDLRVDSLYARVCESKSESVTSPSPAARERRRRFIEDFVPKMQRLQSVKIEGGMPRDERREVIRALHRCPLKKLVMIGVSCPIGNTWGYEGKDLQERLSRDELEELEGEDKDEIWKLGMKDPLTICQDFRFEAQYGWPPSAPMISTIASHHANTIEELKFCGYKGSPSLLEPTPITTPMLQSLKYFHNLKSLIMSFWLSTQYEGAAQDAEIIRYWLNARSPASTALVLITDEEPEGWEKKLRTEYAPDALAWRMTSFLGPYLSETAKARKGGVHVRGSVCVGDWGGIFDVDLRIGKGVLGSDVCFGFTGPREELEPQRREEKMETRKWF